MILRQSDLKMWMACPLRWRFANIDKLPREQTCALTFGTIVHDCVLHLETTRDLPSALERLRDLWAAPEALDPSLVITRWTKGRTWHRYAEDGATILRNWWAIVSWDPDVVVAREQRFEVPLREHTLQGTIDKVALRYLGDTDQTAVLISDYKTNASPPSYEDLSHDLQFTAYAYATTRPEFWAAIPGGDRLYDRYADAPRIGEWVQLRGPHRKSAGERDVRHYNRLAYACDAIADCVALGIYTPSISGATCARCEFADPCGLPTPTRKDLTAPCSR